MLSARQSRVDEDLGERPTPSSGVLSIRGGLRFSHVRGTATLQNVLDHWYYDHLSFQRDPFRSGVRVYEPGRTIHLNAVLTW
jgi:iron complex outermembrane receptor protein